MREFTRHTGVGVPLQISDVDTDQIIPARFCAAVSKEGLDAALFADWRVDPGFPLNQPAYESGSVLVAGENFGSGSSREWAVWALQQYGFRAVIAPRYGDIFRGNSLKNGLLTIELGQERVGQLWNVLDEYPGTPVSVDLVDQSIHCGDVACTFTLDPNTRWRLLNGRDDIGLTELHLDEITEYESRRRVNRPSLTASVTS